MKANLVKCKIMHIGTSNPNHSYTMNSYSDNNPVILEKNEKEKDHAITFYKNHIDIIASKANQLLGIMKNTFSSRDMFLWKKLYTVYIRPNIEFAAPVWNPYLSGDIEKLEKVQRLESINLTT